MSIKGFQIGNGTVQKYDYNSLDNKLGVDDTLTVSGAAADAKKTGDEISDLKSASDGRVFTNVDYDLVRNSYVNQNTGAFVAYNGWDRSDYINIDTTKTLYYKTPERTQYCACYDAQKNFLRKFVLEPDVGKTCFYPDTVYIAISGASADMALTRLYYAEYDNIKREVEDLTATSGNFLYGANWINATMNNGTISNSWIRLLSDRIDVPPGETLNVTFHGSNYKIWFSFFDDEDAFVSNTAFFASDNVFQVPVNATYMRCIAGRMNDANIYPDEHFQFCIAVRKHISKTLKVMTYNVGHYGYGVDYGPPPEQYDEKLINWRRFLGEEKIDIIGIQEYSSTFNREWSTNRIESDDVLWDHFYPFKQQTGSASAIKSVYPLTDRANKQLVTSDRYYTEAVMNGIYLISVHLSVGASQAAVREQEAQEILSILEDHPTFILFGDFNTEPGDEDAFFKKFANAGYSVASCRANLPGSVNYDENYPVPGGFFGKFYCWSNNREDFSHYDSPTGTAIYYLDNIIVSSDIKIKNVYPIPSAYARLSSDHIPLVAELEII